MTNRFNPFQFSEEAYFKQETSDFMDSGLGWNREEAEACMQEAYHKQQQGSLEEAIGLYQKSIDLFPTAEAHTFLGWAYSMQGRYDDAILECQKAIGVDPDFGNPYNDIGAYLIEKKQYDEAIAWLRKATESKRYDAYFYAYYNLGRVWELKGNWFESFEAYSKALDLNADYTLARKALGRLQALMN